MKTRLWYPQLDVYDTVRRLSILILKWKNTSPLLEKVFIADFYLANAPLLHRVKMNNHFRQEFRDLHVSKPEKTFLSYPDPLILFHRMEPIQRVAFQTMVGRGLVDIHSAKQQLASLSESGHQWAQSCMASSSDNETRLAIFLVTAFTTMGDGTIQDLRLRTGLRRSTP